MTLILASQSASRRAMLEGAGVVFEAVPASIDEATITENLLEAGQDIRRIAHELALAKAVAISRAFPSRWVLGSDSMLSVNRQLYDKPRSRDDAADHLRAFSGKAMTLVSAAVLVRDRVMIASVTDDATLETRSLSEGFIQSYLDAEWPAISGCVGCFRIEGRGVQLFDDVRGSHFTVLGMPLLPVLTFLRDHKVIEG